MAVAALSVQAGNTAAQYGAAGTVDVAAFTVTLPLGTVISDGDWITVRGRKCLARIVIEFSQHAPHDRIVVLATGATGG